VDELEDQKLKYDKEKLQQIPMIYLRPLLFSSLIQSLQFLRYPQETDETGGFQLLNLLYGIGSKAAAKTLNSALTYVVLGLTTSLVIFTQ